MQNLKKQVIQEKREMTRKDEDETLKTANGRPFNFNSASKRSPTASKLSRSIVVDAFPQEQQTVNMTSSYLDSSNLFSLE